LESVSIFKTAFAAAFVSLFLLFISTNLNWE
jgi:hypothetical protein